MSHREFERQLVRITGESISTIRRHGFQLIEPPQPEPQIVDWDALDEERVSVIPQRSAPYRRAA